MSILDTGCKSHFVFTPCCGGTPIKFCRNTPPDLQDGAVFQYTGPDIVGYGGVLENGKCYTVSIVNVAADYPSIYAQIVAGNFLRATSEIPCNDEICPECPKKVVIYPCCGGEPLEFAYDPLYPTNAVNAYQYIGAALIFDNNGQALVPNACFRVEIVNTTQEEADSLPPGPSIMMVDLAGKSCGNYEIGIECASCNYYYQITNCANQAETYCTTSNLSAYINNLIEDETLWPVIQVTQHPDKCFYVEQIISCESPVTITPVPSLPAFVGCTACQETLIVYYELINCNNTQEIIYTSQDLHEYIGSYITLLEYGDDCFYVQVASGLVPSDIPVHPTGDTFATCEDCTLPRYLLTDCTGVLEDIVTNTDLSTYVGSVIVIESCPETCWEVFETDITVIDGTVSILGSPFTDCPECLLATLTAKCVSFTNKSEKAIGFEVLYPNLTTNKFTIESGATLAKDCYLQWETVTGLVVTNYGNCINGECPPVPQPKRKVTPGYNTPACTPEYYEKVECNFSEWMYKDVLEKRYGISNCCVDELMRWEIKHEMLMLDALINPDYTCVPPVNCGCPQPTTCNCSCNSGN